MNDIAAALRADSVDSMTSALLTAAEERLSELNRKTTLFQAYGYQAWPSAPTSFDGYLGKLRRDIAALVEEELQIASYLTCLSPTPRERENAIAVFICFYELKIALN